jgi:hypothetical protein
MHVGSAMFDVYDADDPAPGAGGSRPMKIAWLLFLLLPAPQLAAQAPASDEAQLREIKTVLWPKSYREQDVALLSRILHPRFQSIDSEGSVTNRADELEYIRTHKPSYTSFRYDIERLEIFAGSTAVVSGQGTIVSTSEGREQTSRYRSSNHFVKEDGRWLAISSHVSGVEEGASD